MDDDTRPLSPGERADEDAPSRSSWLLRGLFALAGLVILAEIVVIGGLVGYTVLRVSDGGQEGPQAMPGVTPAVPVVITPTPEGVNFDSFTAWDRHGPLNILLLGEDFDHCGAQTEVLHHKTDTMILVRVDPAAGRATMMSLPRDLYVMVPGHGPKKLTMAHYLGELTDYEGGGGPGLLREVIQSNFGLPVHRFVRIDFQGFQDIVDAVGPITVDVPPSQEDPAVGLVDDRYPDGQCGYTTISFPPGPNELDGEQALKYARSRYSTSDFDRSRRQMQVLEAIREAGMRPSVLLDLHKLAPALLDTVDTDLTPREILSLASVARKIDRDDITRLPVDESVLYDEFVFIDNVDQWVLQRDPVAWDALIERFLGTASEVSVPQGEAMP